MELRGTLEVVAVTAAIIFDQGGRVLLTQRSAHDAHGPRWEFPGGKIREGESPEECLKRELQEELGIEAEVKDVFHAVHQSMGDRSVLLLAYLCIWRGGVIQLKEHQAYRWLSPPELLGMDLLEADRPVAAKLVRIIGEGMSTLGGTPPTLWGF